MKHGSLFSGIGGFDLAAEWMGWENIFHCEWNEFGQKILKYYWPNAKSYGDITKTDFSIHRGSIDILTGGFPCQPYSTAGKRKGKEDERHLWPEMLRAIREISPRWIVGENVRGLTNWNGGMVFDEVQADLETEGYQITPFLLPACAVNAPHRRDRIWFVAHAKSIGSGRTSSEASRAVERQDGESVEQSVISSKIRATTNSVSKEQREQTIGRVWAESRNGIGAATDTGSSGTWADAEGVNQSRELLQKTERKENKQFDKSIGTSGDASDSNIGTAGKIRGNAKKVCGLQNEECGTENNPSLLGGDCIEDNRDASDPRLLGQEISEEQTARIEQCCSWEIFPTQSPVCSGDDGLPSELDGITFSKWRNESIKGFGNAIVPQVVYQIFKAIEQYESDVYKLRS